jgi:hypothetical protein
VSRIVSVVRIQQFGNPILLTALFRIEDNLVRHVNLIAEFVGGFFDSFHDFIGLAVHVLPIAGFISIFRDDVHEHGPGFSPGHSTPSLINPTQRFLADFLTSMCRSGFQSYRSGLSSVI